MIAKILGALFLLALAGFGIQTWRASHYESKAAAFQSAVVTFESAQQTNLATIATLQSANADWASKCAANTPEAEKESKDADAYAQHQQLTVTMSKKALHDLSASHPKVREWSSTPVPADVVRILTSDQN